MGLFRGTGVIYKAVDQLDFGHGSNEVYIKANVKAPRVAGMLVKIFAWFLELKIIGTFLVYVLKRSNLIHKLVSNATLEETPMFAPSHPFVDLNEQEVTQIDFDTSPPERVQQAMNCLPSDDLRPSCFKRWTIADYSRAYRSGETTPLRVAEQFIEAVRDSSRLPLPMSFFINYDAEDILRQAKESTHRYERGEPISALDGVPIAIKDEIDCSPYPTTGGTKWLHKVRPCKGDACCVMRLRSCGAVIVGKTNMHELGAGTSGVNPHYGSARNPYDPSKITGGSSSGSAAVVSAGLCPVALGVDSGGSIRMPASLCGVVGLKPTFGRIPQSGILPLNWTVGMVGILAGTLEDAFIVYAAIAGQQPSHQPTTLHPKEYFPLLNSTNPISDIKLARYGETVEVTIPDIESMRLAHYMTIGSETTTFLSSYLDKDVAKSGCDVRVALSVYGSFDSKEYIKAQKIRNRQMQIHNNIFAMADVIVVPTTGVTAYTIYDDTRENGELDYINGAALVRYQIAGNFLGLPAVTVPVGYDKAGLPIGLQFIGKPWSEPTLMHIAFAMQALCISDYKKPRIFYDLLHKNGADRGGDALKTNHT